MPHELNPEVLNRIAETLKELNKFWKEIQPYIPALTIVNQKDMGEATDGADLELSYIDLIDRNIKKTHKLKWGEHLTLDQPVDVRDEVRKEQQSDEPGFREVHQIKGDILKITTSKSNKPGTRAYIKVVNLIDKQLNWMKTIPDMFPWGNGKSKFLSAPPVYSSGQISHFGNLNTWITHPANDKEKEQLILFYSMQSYVLSPKIIIVT